MTDYPLLRNLLGAYLHQDWDREAPDPLSAVLVGVQEDYLDRLPLLLEELERLQVELEPLASERGEWVLYSLGAHISTDAFGYTPVTWTAKLAEEVRQLERTDGSTME